MIRLRRLTCKCVKLGEFYRYGSTVGFIGLGAMGSKLVDKLVTNGKKVIAYDNNPTRTMEVEKKGCIIAKSPKEIGEKAKVVFTLLPSYDAILEVCTADNGLLKGAKKELLLVDLSTIGPVDTMHLNEKFKTKIDFISAPISGTTQSIDQDIIFLVGGKKDLMDKADPYFQVMGDAKTMLEKKIVLHIGTDITDGQAARMCGILLLACTIVGTSEVMNLGIRLGLNPVILKDSLSLTSSRCWACQFYNPVPKVLPNSPATLNYTPGQSVGVFLEGLAVAQDLALKIKSPIPLASLATQMFNVAAVLGYSHKDISIVYKLFKQTLIAQG